MGLILLVCVVFMSVLTSLVIDFAKLLYPERPTHPWRLNTYSPLQPWEIFEMGREVFENTVMCVNICVMFTTHPYCLFAACFRIRDSSYDEGGMRTAAGSEGIGRTDNRKGKI